MAWMKSLRVEGCDDGVDEELVGGKRCWWVGKGACGVNEELVGGRTTDGMDEELVGGRRCS